MIKIFCPNCYSSYDKQPEVCECGYPFSGSEMEKHKFMSIKVKSKTIEKEAKSASEDARNILFAMGGLYALFSIFLIFSSTENTFNFITLTYGILIIILGMFSHKEPFFSLLSGFILIIILYLILGLFNPSALLKGFIFKILFIGGYIAALVKIKMAEKFFKKY